MKHKIIIVLIFLGYFLSFGHTIADYPQIVTQPSINELISIYAREYGASEKQLLVVSVCESKLNPNAIHYNDGGRGKHSVGLFQYQKTTFDAFADLKGEDLDYYSYNDQIKLTAYIFANYPELKSRWTCARIHHIV